MTSINTRVEEYDLVVKSLAEPSTWRDKSLLEAAKPLSTGETRIKIWAEVDGAGKKEIVKVADWSPGDLYYYSDVPLVEFSNAVGVIGDQVEFLKTLHHDVLEFEMQVIELWRRIGKLSSYYGITPAHDELIASLRCLGVGHNALLDVPKVNALSKCIIDIVGRISITDQMLDSMYDLLEEVGFDLDLAMSFAQSD